MYRALIIKEKERLETQPLLPDGMTVKGKYLYTQKRSSPHKVTCTCLGPAAPDQIQAFKNRTRLKLINWTLKNESQFVQAIRLISELKKP